MHVDRRAVGAVVVPVGFAFGAKELPSLLMGTVIVLAGAESAAQINARYGSDPSVTF